MKAVKNIFLVIISFVLVLFLVVSVSLLSANIFFYPEIYQEAIEESDVFSDLEDFTGEEVPGGEFIEFPEEGLEQIVGELINSSLDYLRGDTEELDLTLGIDNDALRDFFEQQAEQIPVCSSGEQPYTDDGELNCRPQNVDVSVFLDEYLEQENITILENGEVDLKEVYGLDEEQLENAREYVSYYNYAKYLSVLLSLVLIGAIFLVSRNVRKGMQFSGISFLASGALVVGIGIVVSIASQQLPIDASLAFVNTFISSLIGSFVSTEMFYGISLLVIGGAVFGGSFFVKNRESKMR